MAATISIGKQQTQIYNSLVPPEGPKSVNEMLDFTSTQQINIDFTLAYMQQVMSVVQTIWCDNSGNSQPITFTLSSTGQTIKVPAGAQGSYPVISAIRPVISAATLGGVIVPVLFLNVPLPSSTWYPGGVPIIAPTGIIVTPAIPTQFFASQVSVTTAATLLLPAQATRNTALITNLGTTDVYLGGAGVTPANGLLLSGIRGANVPISTTAALYGIVAAGSQTVSIGETLQ